MYKRQVLIIGALIGRLRFVPYVVFFIAWSLLVYSPLIHWVWGGGILAKLGYFDFAGGLPVHLIAGFSSLAAVWAVGNRQTPKDGPSNMMYVAIGVGILWAGWLIFNASAALGANEIACLAAINTLISSSTGCIAWSLLEMCIRDRAYGNRGQGLYLLPCIMAGLTGPMKPFGMMVLQNTEILSGIVFSYLLNPATPIVSSPSSSVGYMKRASYITGTPEMMMINGPLLQMAHDYYHMPTRCMCGMTDAKIPDAQAGLETMQNLSLIHI